MRYYSFWKKRFTSIGAIFIVLVQVSASCSGGEDNKENDKEVKNEALPSENEEKIAKLTEVALEKYQKSDYEGAIKEYDKIIELDPNNATVYGNRGVIKGILENIKGAVSDTKKAIELEPDNPVHYHSLATVYFNQNKFKKALDFCNQAIQKDASYDIAYYTRARTQLGLKNKEGACQDFKKALELGMQDAQFMIDENCK